LALEAVPESREQGTGNREQEDGEPVSEKSARKAARTMLEARMEAVLAELMTPTGAPDATVRQGHLALLKRWYYRPETKRPGEIFFPDEEGGWPVRALLRGVGRIAAKSLTAETASQENV
jgi:hypothetical protein